jgi:hypothetical protein
LQPHQVGGFGNVWGFFSSHKSSFGVIQHRKNLYF